MKDIVHQWNHHILHTYYVYVVYNILWSRWCVIQLVRIFLGTKKRTRWGIGVQPWWHKNHFNSGIIMFHCGRIRYSWFLSKALLLAFDTWIAYVHLYVLSNWVLIGLFYGKIVNWVYIIDLCNLLCSIHMDNKQGGNNFYPIFY